MAEFTRFAETLECKKDMRVVAVTVKPLVSDCTGRIWFTDLMAQEGDRLTGYVIHTETVMEKYRENGEIVPPRFYNGLVRSWHPAASALETARPRRRTAFSSTRRRATASIRWRWKRGNRQGYILSSRKCRMGVMRFKG